MNATPVSVTILLLSEAVVILDALFTRRELRRGFREINPILRCFLKKFGSIGLILTRIAAVGLLLLLFGILETSLWILFGSTFSAVMGCVILVGLRRTQEAAADRRMPGQALHSDKKTRDCQAGVV